MAPEANPFRDFQDKKALAAANAIYAFDFDIILAALAFAVIPPGFYEGIEGFILELFQLALPDAQPTKGVDRRDKVKSRIR